MHINYLFYFSKNYTIKYYYCFVHFIFCMFGLNYNFFFQYTCLKMMIQEAGCVSFFNIKWETNEGMIKVKTNENSQRGYQFQLLCTGENNCLSYKNTQMTRVTDRGNRGQTVWAGNYDGRGGKNIVPDYVDGVNCVKSLERGIVIGDYGLTPKKAAQFGICLIDHKGYKCLSSFGTVVDGLSVST